MLTPALLSAHSCLHSALKTLQVHDEVILEGPRETAEEARRQVVACMRSPFSGLDPKPLLVDLLVDSKFADTWYEAK